MTKEEDTNSLVVILDDHNAMDLFTTPNGLDPILAGIRAEIDGFLPDVSTAKGRKAIASMAANVSKSKVYLDGKGKALVDRLKEQPKLVDAERRRMRDLLDQWRDEVRLPLTEYEQAEKERLSSITAKIDAWKMLADANYSSAAQAQEALETVSGAAIDESFQEFAAVAIVERDKCVSNLRDLLAKAVEHERIQAENARLLAEKTERDRLDLEESIRKEANEKAIRDAEARHKAELEESMRREVEARVKAEKAEREKADAIAKAEQEKALAVEDERRKAEEERRKQAEEDAENKRVAEEQAANLEHRKSRNRAALDSLIKIGFQEDQAKKFITAVASGKVAFVAMIYGVD